MKGFDEPFDQREVEQRIEDREEKSIARAERKREHPELWVDIFSGFIDDLTKQVTKEK